MTGPAGANGNGAEVRTVVVLDDEPDVVEAIAQLLESGGPEAVIVATVSPEEALRRVRQGIALLLTDFRMPTMDGLQVARAARTIDAALPIFLVTAYADDTVEDHAAESGIHRVIHKPLDPSGFLRTVRGQLGLA